MKKSNYVSKYDYLAFYSVQPSFWFFTNAEILSAINTNIEFLNNSIEVDYEEDDDQQDYEIDGFELYKQGKLDNLAFDITDQDKYTNLYLKNLLKYKDVDKNNPLITEGKIIDQESKTFIKNHFNINNNYFVYDFDESNIKLLEEQAKYTQELISKYPNLIIFQPVFIDDKRNIITKCDALVKTDIEMQIIETKGTTTTKFIHFLDLFYQSQLLSNIAYLHEYGISYFLCLIKYCKANKNVPLPFIISETCNLTKKSNCPSSDNINEKQLFKLGEKWKKNEDVSFYINGNLTKSDFFTSHDQLKNRLQVISCIYDEFEDAIKQLWSVKKSLNAASYIKTILLNKYDYPKLLDNPFIKELRTLYSLYCPIYKYSGNVYRISDKNIDLLLHNEAWKDLSKNEFINFKHGDSYKLIKDYPYIINKDIFLKKLNNLKSKCVYFDFETINTGFRVIDNSLPFMQIVTQASIIKKHDDNYDHLKCENLMADPLNIDINWFKNIIDSLYESNEYSYVVYNKSFEQTRLKEMIDIINEPEYTYKINVIINNIYDIADFFILSKQTLYLPELYGYYSIKKVLPIINKLCPEFFHQVGCKNYKELNIGNGLVCQNQTKARFFNMLAQDEWDQVVKDSKIYCENDVRAMIAVELFIKEYVFKKLMK